MNRTSRTLPTRFVALALTLASVLVVLLGFSANAYAGNPPDSCPATSPITSIPPADLTTTGTTVGAPNNVPSIALGCNGHFTQVAGGEVVFPVQLLVNAAFDITVTPTSAWDPSIYFVTADGTQACDSTSCSTGLGADDNGVSGAEQLHISGKPAGTYYIVVDSFYSTGDARSAGTFSLKLHGTLGGTPTTTTISSSSDPSVVGQPVTLTATVAPTSGPGTPTGNVTFFVDGSPLLTTSLGATGTAALPISGPFGVHNIAVSYAGDATFAASTSSLFPQDIDKDAPVFTVTANPEPSTFGASVDFSASVSSAFAPPSGGTVTINIDGVAQTPGVFTGTPVHVLRADLAPGPHSITATYSGDGSVAGGTSAPINHNVNAAGTTTTIGSSTGGASVVFGTAVTFTATVTSPGGTPTGSVTFTVDGAPTPASLDGTGTATLTLSTLTVGAHSISAAYVASADFGTSTSATLSQPVSAIVTATTLTASPEPSDASQSVTFTATVSPSPGAEAAAIVFTIDGTNQAPSALNASGAATLSTTTLSPGPHTIGASYAGDATHNSSTATPLTHTVNKVASSITLTADPTTSVFLQLITFSVAITPATSPFGPPSGTVEFFEGATSLGTATLDGAAKASFPTIFPVGTHSVTAKFGDANFAETTSSAVIVTVNKAATTTTAGSSTNPAIVGQPLSLLTQVSVVAPGGGTPPGSVTFFEGPTSLGTVVLDGTGNASLPVTLPVGPHTITATYAGTGSYAGSSSTQLAQTIAQTGASIQLTSSVDPAPRGTAVTFTATVIGIGLPAQPTGDVVFTADGNPLGTSTLEGTDATVSTSTLTGGSHTIVAVYQGDTNFTTTQAQFVERITPANTSTTVTSTPNPSANLQSVTFTATVTSTVQQPITGTVFFLDGTSALGTAAVTNGVAAFSTSGLRPGIHEINAAYAGTVDFAPSHSLDHEQEVKGIVPPTTTSSDAGTPAPDAGAPEPTNPIDSGVGSGDGSVSAPPPPGEQFDGGFNGLNIGANGNDGCSCQTAGASRASSALGLLTGLAFAGALVRRRRKRAAAARR